MGLGKRLWDVARANASDFASAFSLDDDARERRRFDKELDEQVAKEVADGIYEAKIALPETGAYYVYISVPSLKLGYSDGAYLSLMARGAPLEPKAGASKKN